MPDAPRYQTHGALVPGDPLYVRRRADEDLKEGVLAGDFCYVLAPRQVGKSSLRAQALVELRSAGVMVATANIQAGGGVKSEAVWYEGVIDQLVTSARDLNPGFALPFEWGKWWDAERGPLAQRFVKLLKEGFLAPTDCRWVITIDEIDASISLPFTDSFFAAIRLCFDQRPEQPAFRRLSIVLLGAATPTELIQDRSRTPFNIGRRVEMTDFTLAEAEPLAAPLPVPDSLKPATLARVLHWTGGQPHLTQVICEKLRAIWKEGQAAADAAAATAEVDRCVESTFFHGGILGDAHFAYITKRARDFPRARQLLRAYRKARSNEGLPDAQRSTVAAELKIAGLVKPDQNGTLRVANPIYERVFNEKWIRDTTPVNWPAVIGEVGMAAAVLTLIVGYFTFIPAPYIKQLQTADKDLPSEAHRKLAAIPGYKNKADELLAQFWDRRAARSEVGWLLDRILRNPPEIALIYRLRAFEAFPTDARQREAARIVREKLASLRSTFRERAAVLDATFSPDGNIVLTRTYGPTLLLWDVQSGQPKGLPRQDRMIWAKVFSPNGNTLLTGGEDGTARFWDAKSGQPIGVPLQHRGGVWAVAFSPDGNTVATGSEDETARFWDAKSGQPIGVPLQHEGGVSYVAFSPDGNTVATGSRDKTARFWDAKSGQPKGAPLQHEGGVSYVAFSPDGNTLLTKSFLNTARLWDVQSGQPKGLPIRNQNILNAFSPDSNTVLTESSDRAAQILDVQNGQPKGVPFQHKDRVATAAFSPDGSVVLTGSRDHTARLWDAQNAQPKGMPIQHQESVSVVEFSPDGNTALTGSRDGIARLWDVATIEGGGERVEEALEGKPAAVLDRWLKRTALKFAEDGVTLIPRYPLPEPPEKDAKPYVP